MIIHLITVISIISITTPITMDSSEPKGQHLAAALLLAFAPSVAIGPKSQLIELNTPLIVLDLTSFHTTTPRGQATLQSDFSLSLHFDPVGGLIVSSCNASCIGK